MATKRDAEGPAFFLTVIFYTLSSWVVGMMFGGEFGWPMYLFLIGTVFHTVFKESISD